MRFSSPPIHHSVLATRVPKSNRLRSPQLARTWRQRSSSGRTLERGARPCECSGHGPVPATICGGTVLATDFADHTETTTGGLDSAAAKPAILPRSFAPLLYGPANGPGSQLHYPRPALFPAA